MRRKLLSVVLCVCMMMTMAPFAFAEGVSSGGGSGSSAATLQSKIDALGSEGGTVTLDNDYTETITIKPGINITLNLNNHNLSSSTGNAIVNKGTLTIEGKGQVSTTAKGSAAIANFPDAVANVNGGTYTSSEWYVIKNLGTMTITGDVTVKKPDGSQNTASLIDNGWVSSIDTVAGVQVSAQSDKATLTIKSGNFEGKSGANSCSVVKNDDYGNLKIFGGTFDSTANNNTNNSTTILNWNVAEISGGNFTGKYPISNGAYTGNADKGQLTISGGTFTGTQSMFGYCMGGNGVGEMTISGGSFTAPQIGDFTGKYTLSISGGTFSFDPITYLATGYTAKPSNSKYLVVPTEEANAVAQIGNTYYNTLADAVADASNSSKDTIKLLRNTPLNSTVSISKPVVLDLGGYVLNGAGTLLDLYGDVTLQNGTIETTGAGTGAVWVNQTAKLTVNNDVLMNTTQASSFAIAYWRDCTTAEVTFRGKITGGNGITVNGLITGTTTENKLTVDGATINVGGHGIYQAGNATTALNNSAITGATGIEIRAGKLNVDNSTITGNGTFKCEANDNGTTTDGVGIAIAQHTTKLPINVTISGGTISGTYAVYESNPQDNNDDSIAKVKLSITDGNFNGSTAAVYSQDVKDFITGGLFTTDPTAYCGTKDSKKLTGIPSGNSSYPFTIGEINAAVKVAEGNSDAKNAPDNSTFDNSITQDTVKSVASSATASLSGASGNVAKTINDTTITKATADLGNLANGKNVVVLVQPYLEITPTGSNIENNIKSISLNIEPKYNLIATTSDVVVSDPSNIKITDGVDKNAVLMESAKPLTVTTPTPVTVTLPTDFATAGNSVYIKHEASNGKIYYYTAIVGEDYKITFTTKNGFSPFTISTTSEAVAEVDGIGYATFQDAVDAVENGGTIKALKNIDSTVSGNKRFKVNANEKTVKLIAASGYSLTNNGDTYTVSRQSSGGPGSSGGSISTPTTYAVNVNAATNGAVAADKKTASKGTTVTVTASPSKGYVVDAVKVVDKDGKDVAVTEKDGKYVFTMPASAVTVTGSFKAETPAPVALPFTDVKSGNWFYDAVKYAYAQGLMTGTSATTFAPNGTMNRAMIVTVLYRLEKSPAVTGASKFTDVPAGQWYSDAVAWAAANKIVNGYDETTFGPMNAVTREQMAAILFRYEQVKGLENVTLEENLNRFPDQNKISAYAIPALQWAVGQKIINGNADGTLDPTGTATRAQVAQIFTNLLNK